MNLFLAHITAFEMSSYLVVFALGCLVGGSAVVRFLRRSDANRG